MDEPMQCTRRRWGRGGGAEGPWAGAQTPGFEALKMSIFSPIFPYFFCLTLLGISFL